MGAGRGSSPLSRGIPLMIGGISSTSRIIPALAGNTSRYIRGTRINQDHPRSRGEYVFERTLRSTGLGSSPLSRGIRTAREDSVKGFGIIPALAGNTQLTGVLDDALTDHPRSRGEYFSRAFITIRDPGSSPLSRGILRAAGGAPICWGIIPALAGNTEGRQGSYLDLWDHPRSRGEYAATRGPAEQ